MPFTPRAILIYRERDRADYTEVNKTWRGDNASAQAFDYLYDAYIERDGDLPDHYDLLIHEYAPDLFHTYSHEDLNEELRIQRNDARGKINVHALAAE